MVGSSESGLVWCFEEKPGRDSVGDGRGVLVWEVESEVGMGFRRLTCHADIQAVSSKTEELQGNSLGTLQSDSEYFGLVSNPITGLLQESSPSHHTSIHHQHIGPQGNGGVVPVYIHESTGLMLTVSWVIVRSS